MPKPLHPCMYIKKLTQHQLSFINLTSVTISGPSFSPAMEQNFLILPQRQVFLKVSVVPASTKDLAKLFQTLKIP
jgi:hypothetical protein